MLADVRRISHNHARGRGYLLLGFSSLGLPNPAPPSSLQRRLRSPDADRDGRAHGPVTGGESAQPGTGRLCSAASPGPLSSRSSSLHPASPEIAGLPSGFCTPFSAPLLHQHSLLRLPRMTVSSRSLPFSWTHPSARSTPRPSSTLGIFRPTPPSQPPRLLLPTLWPPSSLAHFPESPSPGPRLCQPPQCTVLTPQATPTLRSNILCFKPLRVSCPFHPVLRFPVSAL